MTVIAGWMLILFMVLLTRAVGRHGGMLWPRTRCGRCGVLVLGAVLALLWFRPDEELESGEDPGAYFNAALSFAQQHRLTFPDPALAGLPAAERILFRYGHAGFLITKDAVLWAEDESMETVGPHFFPAYSLLLAVPVSFGWTYGMFLITPILAVLIGWMLALLARRLTGSGHAAWITFGLYILNPVIFWNARCLRAEWPASFLVFAGLSLWMARVVCGKPVGARAAWLGGSAVAGAALFHVTALYVMIPAVIASLWLTRKETFWVGWWGGLLTGGVLFAAQLVWITDPYWMLPLLGDANRRIPVLAAALMVPVVTVGLRYLVQWMGSDGLCNRCGLTAWRDTVFRSDIAIRGIGGFLGILFIAAIGVSVVFTDELGRIPGLPDWTVAYLSLTDFRGVIRMVSRTGFLVAALGLVWMPSRTGAPGRMGRWLLVWMAPASLTIGWVFNYMFETRRMVTFLIPLLVLSMTVLMMTVAAAGQRMVERWWPDRPVFRVGVMPVTVWTLFVVLAALGIRGRTQLFTTWNNRGAYRYYDQLADDVRHAGDFLFAEYTQTAVPVERLSGLPLLPVAWGYRSQTEYREAESVLRGLVHDHPERRHLLMTPFAGAAVPGLSLEPLLTQTLSSHRLGRARRAVPRQVVPRGLTMTVYRALPRAPPDGHPVYTRLMNGGRLGMSGGANIMWERDLSMHGMALDAGPIYRIDLPLPAPEQADRFFFVFHANFSKLAAKTDLRVRWSGPLQDEGGAGIRRFSPAPEWWVIEMPRPAGTGTAAMVEISVPDTAFLTDILYTPGMRNAVGSLRNRLELEPFTIPSVNSQWMHAESALALPVRSTPDWLWILAATGQPEKTAGATLSVTRRNAAAPAVAASVTPEWRWTLLPLPASQTGTGVFEWYDFRVDPPWNPRLPDFPDDLGLRVRAVATLPRAAREANRQTVAPVRNPLAEQ